LMYMRNRYYDPATGRFTQQDPIGLAGGLNLYGFANGDPVNFSDPFGLNPWWRLAFAGARGGVVVGGLIGGVPGAVIAGVVGAGLGAVGGILIGDALGDALFNSDSAEDITQDGAQDGSSDRTFTADQDAAIQLAKEAVNKGGLTEDEARALIEQAREVGLRARGPEAHEGRGFGSRPHIHIGPINHIPIIQP
jgi:uncharacterized protein RhaS with RHS repeats